MKQHLGRQSGVQKVEVGLLEGKVDIEAKEDGQIDPAGLLKATYDSGVSVAEMDIIAQGRVVKDASGNLSFQIAPNRSFVFVPNDLSKGLDALAGTATQVTIRGQLYKTPSGKHKAEVSSPLKLLILEVRGKR